MDLILNKLGRAPNSLYQAGGMYSLAGRGYLAGKRKSDIYISSVSSIRSPHPESIWQVTNSYLYNNRQEFQQYSSTTSRSSLYTQINCLNVLFWPGLDDE